MLKNIIKSHWKWWKKMINAFQKWQKIWKFVEACKRSHALNVITIFTMVTVMGICNESKEDDKNRWEDESVNTEALVLLEDYWMLKWLLLKKFIFINKIFDNYFFKNECIFWIFYCIELDPMLQKHKLWYFYSYSISYLTYIMACSTNIYFIIEYLFVKSI